MAASLVGCELGSYDDAVKEFNQNAPPPPPLPPPPPGASFGPNFSEIQAALFTPSCATIGCHSGAGADAGLNLEAGSSYMNLIGIASSQDPGTQRVNPGNPDMSYLITKLEGPGVMGGPMPPTGGPVPQPDIDVIRQWITQGAIDDTVQSTTPVRVASIIPAAGAPLTMPPAQITAGFDREVDASTVGPLTFLLDASGGDAIFGNANDVAITAASVTVPPANPQSAIFDLTGVALADDTYRVTLVGDGGAPILDLDANALDGDADGNEGGNFTSQFTITTPVVLGATLDQIQAVVFTPSCASAACHDAGSPAADLDLSTADRSFGDLVGVSSLNKAGATRVIAFDADNSYLIQKLENDPDIVGQVMPIVQPLDQAVIDVIRQWITDGAER